MYSMRKNKNHQMGLSVAIVKILYIEEKENSLFWIMYAKV